MTLEPMYANLHLSDERETMAKTIYCLCDLAFKSEADLNRHIANMAQVLVTLPIGVPSENWTHGPDA